MFEQFFPYGYAQSVFVIDYERLYQLGYRGLIFDVDNTLVHHGDPSNDQVEALFRRLSARGFKTVLLSDNDEPRLEAFTANMDVPFVADAEKPSTKGYEAALRILGLEQEKEKALVIGDQVFTDIRGANASGLASVLVHFIKLPSERRIGKRRYIEKGLLALWRRSKRYYGRLGSIEIQPTAAGEDVSA